MPLIVYRKRTASVVNHTSLQSWSTVIQRKTWLHIVQVERRSPVDLDYHLQDGRSCILSFPRLVFASRSLVRSSQLRCAQRWVKIYVKRARILRDIAVIVFTGFLSSNGRVANWEGGIETSKTLAWFCFSRNQVKNVITQANVLCSVKIYRENWGVC